MFDSLNRHMLSAYGSNRVKTPNFSRFAERSVTFDNFYVGSMPCMPARRELHTGRLNFLHCAWGPIEPWDDSMPEILKNNGVYSHLITDHYHYFEDGGLTYHPRYSTWEFIRGQAGDPWKAEVKDPNDINIGINRRNYLTRPDTINRKYIKKREQFPQDRCFSAGLEFIEANCNEDNWFLQIECFDPHEPFFAPKEFIDMYPDEYDGPFFDWPDYRKVDETPEQVEHLQNQYAALVSFCDYSLGRVLDIMDEKNMWEDTMLIVNADHGFLLGEHGYWAKTVAHLEWVWTTPPIFLNAEYNLTCVIVSEDGFSFPSILFPSRSTITISSGVMTSYSTPDALITTRLLSRSIPDTFPHVKVTRLYFGRSILAS
jgi:arylsulfatase A-like enzyme